MSSPFFTSCKPHEFALGLFWWSIVFWVIKQGCTYVKSFVTDYLSWTLEMIELNPGLRGTFKRVGVAQKPISYYYCLGILLCYWQKYNPEGWYVTVYCSFLSKVPWNRFIFCSFLRNWVRVFLPICSCRSPILASCCLGKHSRMSPSVKSMKCWLQPGTHWFHRYLVLRIFFP